MKNYIKHILCSAVATVAFVSALAGQAKAGTFTSCTLGTIGNDYNGMRLKLQCTGSDSSWHYTNPGGSCPTASIDQIKLWHSMAMSAFLAGKHLNITYTDPAGSCGVRTIANIDITP